MRTGFVALVVVCIAAAYVSGADVGSLVQSAFDAVGSLIEGAASAPDALADLAAQAGGFAGDIVDQGAQLLASIL